MSMGKTIYVYENWSSEVPTKLGMLYVEQGRGSEHYAFEYDETWLTTNRFAYVLDPDLALYKGRQYPINKNTFGIFADSSPDRWGRVLMQRREKFLADKEGRKPRKLLDSDYLLGVYDKPVWEQSGFLWKMVARSCPMIKKPPRLPGLL